MPESFSQILSLNSNEIANDEHFISPGSLEKLELELTELLKSRRGVPVSIASLPMMYYEKYGRMLQAEGYLTESQRHGKAGYSLTKLLARLKNSIRLIDRCNMCILIVFIIPIKFYPSSRICLTSLTFYCLGQASWAAFSDFDRRCSKVLGVCW
jgi:hypothetical protein